MLRRDGGTAGDDSRQVRLSKGTVRWLLRRAGTEPERWLETLNTYEKNGGDFRGSGQNQPAGIEFSSGTLGLGLAYGAGLALWQHGCGTTTYQVSSSWVTAVKRRIRVGESVMFAAHAKLTNLVAIVDRNGMQSDGCTAISSKIDIEAMWRGFGWEVVAKPGTTWATLEALQAEPGEIPRVVVANTVRSKEQSEGNNEWHHNRL